MLNEDQIERLRAAADDMDVPGSASQMLIHTAAMLDAMQLIGEVLDNPDITQEDRDKTVQVLNNLANGSELQDDLRHLAEYFESQPSHNHLAWIDTNAFHAFQEEEEDSST